MGHRHRPALRPSRGRGDCDPRRVVDAREGELPRPNIFTARALPDDPDAWPRRLPISTNTIERLVRRIQEVLEDAPMLGPLLKVEEALEREIRAADPTADPDETRLFAGVAADAFGRAEAAILTAIRASRLEGVGDPGRAALAAEAADAIGFVDAMRQRYDAVLMNPPFGEPDSGDEGRTCGRHIHGFRLATHESLRPLLSGGAWSFAEGNGYHGSDQLADGLFLKTFEPWRREVVLGNRLVAFVDLGSESCRAH